MLTPEERLASVERNRERARERYRSMKRETGETIEHDKKKKLTKLLVIDMLKKAVESLESDDTTEKIMKLHVKELLNSGNLQITLR